MKKKRAVAYARYSSDNQREESIDGQIRLIHDYAEKENIELLDHYADKGISGTTADRPAFQQMLVDSRKGLFDCVIVYKLDRFARNMRISTEARGILEDNGVKLISVKEDFGESAYSIPMMAFTEGMSEAYIVNLRQDIKRGQEENALKCKHNGGKPPFGYRVDENQEYIIHDEEAIAVTHIFESYINGETHNQIISWLHRNGFKTAYGNKFQKTSILSILRNERYYGLYTYGKRKRVRRNGILVDSIRDKDDMVRVENGMPAIITKETFENAQIVMEEKSKGGRKSIDKDYMLSGILYCGTCGSTMTGSRLKQRSGNVYYKYRCSGKYKKGSTCRRKDIHTYHLDKTVLNYLEQKFFNKAIIEQATDDIMKIYHESTGNKNMILNNIKDREKEVNTKIDNLVKAISNGAYNNSIQKQLDKLEDEQEVLQIEKIDYLLNTEDSLKREDVYEYLDKGIGIGKKGHKERQEFMKTLAHKVQLYDDKVKIIVNSTPSSNNVSCKRTKHGEGGI